MSDMVALQCHILVVTVTCGMILPHSGRPAGAMITRVYLHISHMVLLPMRMLMVARACGGILLQICDMNF